MADHIERPHEAAYIRYVSDGLADTDGYFSPLDYEAWAATFAPRESETGEKAQQETESEIPQESKSDSVPQAESDSVPSPLAYFAGGADGIAERLAADEEQACVFRALLDEMHLWVRLSDTVERMTAADAYDLLGQAYADGAEWDGSVGYEAARWDGVHLVVGPDGASPTV